MFYVISDIFMTRLVIEIEYANTWYIFLELIIYVVMEYTFFIKHGVKFSEILIQFMAIKFDIQLFTFLSEWCKPGIKLEWCRPEINISCLVLLEKCRCVFSVIEDAPHIVTTNVCFSVCFYALLPFYVNTTLSI